MKPEIDNALSGKKIHEISEEPTYSGINSFYRRKYSKDLKGVDVAVTGIPLDLTVTHRPGTRFGPRAIRQASAIMAWEIPWPWSFNPFEELTVIDYGDCFFDPGRPETICQSIEDHAATILKSGASLLALGGDHYISYPLLKAYAKVHGPLSLIHFDAHSDTWAEDEKRMDHGSMFYHAAQEGLIVPERSVQVGLRTQNDDTHGLNIINARMVHEMGPKAVADNIKRVVGDHKVYLTFDIDCLDPAFAPGTGTPVIGGLSSFQALEIIRALPKINLAGMDVVEVSPPYDAGEVTALAAATIAAELLCLKVASMAE